MSGAEIAAAGKGKSLSWRSRSGSDANWWTSAVEISSSLASKMDQVPTTIAGLTVGARDQLKSQLHRGSSFSSFTLPWKINMEGNKVFEASQHQEQVKFVSEAPRHADHRLDFVKLPPNTSKKLSLMTIMPTEKSPFPDMETPHVSESSPVVSTDGRSSSRLGESRRRTKRMPVDVVTPNLKASPHSVTLSTVSQEFLLGEPVVPGSARVHSLEVLQRQQFWTPREARTDSPKSNLGCSSKRVDGSSLSSSRRSYSSRSLARGQLFEEPVKITSPHIETPDSNRIVQSNKVGVVLPRNEIFPGNTNSLPQLKIRTLRNVDNLSELSKNPVVGGSSRVVQSYEVKEEDLTHTPVSLPSTPRCSSEESRTSRLLRKLKLTGRGSRVASADTKSGKRKSTVESGKILKELESKVVFDLHQQQSTSNFEPRKLDFSYKNWRSPDFEDVSIPKSAEVSDRNGADCDTSNCVESEGVGADNGCEALQDSFPRASKQRGKSSLETPEKKSSSWWLFKWKWGLRSRSKIEKEPVKNASIPLEYLSTGADMPGQSVDTSPSADIMTDARETFLSQSDRFSSAGSAEKLALDKAPRHKRGLSWGSGSTSTLTPFTPSHPRLPTRDAQELLLPPRKLLFPLAINVVRTSQEQVAGAFPETKVGYSNADTVRASTDSDIFEDCFGSFRSADSPTKSFGSFRSIESPGVSSSSLQKRASSLEEDEWDSQPLSPSRKDLNGTIEDVDGLYNSASRFVFKCPRVQEFNKFLRAQKKRLRSGLEKGNTDCFCIILPGKDFELSSMVAAMCYAWVQENSFPKVSGDTWHPVPLIDLPRQHMHKHKDAAWLFDACGIDPVSLIFADEMEMSGLVGDGRIKLCIVGQDVLVTRNEVGSVCTLLMESLLDGYRSLLQPRYMKLFLLAGILLDTENLDFASMRDTEMSNLLVEGLVSLRRTSFYNRLKEVDQDLRVLKIVTQNYGDGNQLLARSKIRLEADHEHSDKESVFTQSQDQTSTSEAGTNSSLEEDSPRPKFKQRSSFKYTRLTPHSAPARSHRLSVSGLGCNEDAKAVAHIRKAATQSVSSANTGYGHDSHRTRSSTFTRIRKRLFYEA